MTLAEIFEQLTFGELSQLQMGGLTQEKIEENDYRKVLTHINLGLNELYKRFRLRVKEVRIDIQPQISEYVLHDKFAEQNKFSPEVNRYIIDSVYDPFKNIVLQIEQLFDSEGHELCLNDNIPCPTWSPPEWGDCQKTVYVKQSDCFVTPRYDTIRVPSSFTGMSFYVSYRAGHDPLKYEYCHNSPEDVEVNLPPGLLEPLLLFIGHRAYRALNSDQNQESSHYLKQFEVACTQAHDLGLEIPRNPSNVKLDYHGWV